MAKKAAKNLPTSTMPISDPLELNRWCIEMAVRWPVRSIGSYWNGMAQGALGYQGPRHEDEDVIGRANKIMAWVKTAH